jgi:hypothetical protein
VRRTLVVVGENWTVVSRGATFYGANDIGGLAAVAAPITIKLGGVAGTGRIRQVPNNCCL